MYSKSRNEESDLPKKNVGVGSGTEQMLGDRLKYVRHERRKMSSAELHRLTGISKSSLTRYEKGDRTPGAAELRVLCDVLRVSPSYLLWGDERDFGQLSTSVYDLEIKSDNQFVAIVSVLLYALPRPDRTALLQLLMSSVSARIGEDKVMKLTRMMTDFSEEMAPEIAEILVTALPRYEKKLEESK